MIIVMALLEVVGVASVMPFISVLANPEVVESNLWLNAVYTTLGFRELRAFIFFLGIVVFAFLVLSIGFKALTTYALLRYTMMCNYSLSKRLVAGYLYQPYDWFLNRHSADLGKTILSEVQRVVIGSIVPMMQLIAGCTVALALLALLISVDPMLALAAIVSIGGAYVLIYLALRHYLVRIGDESLQANRERYEVVQEAFGGIKDVKVAGLEGAMVNRYDGPAKLFVSNQASSQVVSQLPRFALEIVTFGGILAVVLHLMASRGGLQQALPVIALFAFAGYRLMPALQQIYGNLSKVRFSGPALEALHQDFKRLDKGQELIRHYPEPLGLNEDITLGAVHYTYPGAERPTLNNLTLTIPARKTVGLVGTTGSGKTTMVDIILGLLTPSGGELQIDGKSMIPKNVRAWQRTIGYVSQHIYLSDDTIAANIAFGMPVEHINMDAVERAARVANLHDFVINDMAQGYATKVGERGVRLSGGQRQRIGIARALYHDPDVLILDEATSALDSFTEQAVMEAVHNLGHRKTIILIAHRLSTVQGCDTIFLLEKGELKGQGSFDELIESNERFRAMVANR
ncbi:MAG: ABC transporter ATP-binding protein [Candidatus Marinimicrobia bacterium]|nr:ABC transporter ATP-binding protein [Candidatus Neomarinimicrobiota bacterium]